MFCLIEYLFTMKYAIFLISFIIDGHLDSYKFKLVQIKLLYM